MSRSTLERSLHPFSGVLEIELGRLEHSWDAVSEALLRYAEDERYAAAVASLLSRVAHKHLSSQPYYRRYFRLWEASGFHLTPVHFYSPIPDTRMLHEDLWEQASELPGVGMNDDVQLRLLREAFPEFRDEYETIPFEPSGAPHEFFFNNGMFSGTDALALYCMVRHFRPGLVIEVGSGFSSLLSAQALRKNGRGELVCIEPYPSPPLVDGFPGLTTLIAERVQDVDPQLFDRLGEHDILFIDSSHVVQIGGDVNHLFLEVIPRIKPGVLVHVHDVYLPHEYRKKWVLEELRFWSEQYILRAFLAFNSEFEVLLCNSYLRDRYLEELMNAFPRSPWWGGGSFWMRRRPA